MSQSERDVLQQSDAASGAGFDIHGVVGIEVAPDTPGASQLRDMLAPFLGQSSASREWLSVM